MSKTPVFYVEYPFLVHQLRFNVESVPVAMLNNSFDAEFVPGVMLQQLMLTSNPGFFVGASDTITSIGLTGTRNTFCFQSRAIEGPTA